MPKKRSARILVVEDEPEVAGVIRDALGTAGFECVLAASADEADVAVGANDIDAVTLDVCMPGRTGIEWLEAIATRRPALARKAVVVTGADLDRKARSAVRRHGAGLLFKPFSLQELVREVRGRLEMSPPGAG